MNSGAASGADGAARRRLPIAPLVPEQKPRCRSSTQRTTCLLVHASGSDVSRLDLPRSLGFTLAWRHWPCIMAVNRRQQRSIPGDRANGNVGCPPQACECARSRRPAEVRCGLGDVHRVSVASSIDGWAGEPPSGGRFDRAGAASRRCSQARRRPRGCARHRALVLCRAQARRCAHNPVCAVVIRAWRMRGAGVDVLVASLTEGTLPGINGALRRFHCRWCGPAEAWRSHNRDDRDHQVPERGHFWGDERECDHADIEAETR